MTDKNDMLNIADDTTLGAALRAEVPAHSDSYWASIDDRINAASVADAEVTSVDELSLDISAAANGNTSMVSTRLRTRLRTWPVLAAAAALVLIAGLLTVRLLPSDGERVDAGFADSDTPVALKDLPGPTQNLDHWHAAYGIWDCTANDGNGAWLPAFQSTEDDSGIHSHQDGLIYIHPFFEESAGRNATFSHFADSMNFTITDDTITLEDGTALAEGAMCNGEPAVLEMYRWQDDRALRLDPTLPPRVITSDFGAERFYNDYEVWTLALTAPGADVPFPPQDRFDELSLWWDERDGTEALTQAELDQSDVDWAPPAHDMFTSVVMAETGDEADRTIAEVIGWTDPRSSFRLDGFVLGSGTRWLASSPDADAQVVIVGFEIIDPGIDPDGAHEEPKWACQAVAFPEQELTVWLSCGPSDVQRDQPPSLSYTSTLPNNPAISVTDAPSDAAWLVIETETGTRVLADVVDGVSYAAWPSSDGLWTQMEMLKADYEVVWTETCRLPTTMFCAGS